MLTVTASDPDGPWYDIRLPSDEASTTPAAADVTPTATPAEGN